MGLLLVHLRSLRLLVLRHMLLVRRVRRHRRDLLLMHRLRLLLRRVLLLVHRLCLLRCVLLLLVLRRLLLVLGCVLLLDVRHRRVRVVLAVVDRPTGVDRRLPVATRPAGDSFQVVEVVAVRRLVRDLARLHVGPLDVALVVDERVEPVRRVGVGRRVLRPPAVHDRGRAGRLSLERVLDLTDRVLRVRRRVGLAVDDVAVGVPDLDLLRPHPRVLVHLRVLTRVRHLLAVLVDLGPRCHRSRSAAPGPAGCRRTPARCHHSC